MNPVLKNNMIIEFRALGKEALAMDQYDLEAASNKSYSAQDWAEFLQEPDIRDYIKREMRVIRESSINKIIADAGTSHSVGQAQLISALQKVADDDKEADGPVFIYCYVPLNDEQMHAPNVQEVDRFGFPKSLRPYQKDDVNFLVKHPCTGCFNEQRTGKTPTALMTVKERGLEDTRVLVITTSSALYQWKNEYNAWLNRPCVVVDGTPKKKEEAIQNWTHGLIISYGSIKETSTREGHVKEILKKQPTMVILDEAHTIRNPRTWVAKTIFKLTKIPYRLALTGTPAYGEAKDVFSILKFLFPDKFNSAYKFYEEYFKPDTIFIGFGKTKTEYKYFLPGKEKQLQAFMNQYCTQRKRKDVMQWLLRKIKKS